MTFDNQNVRTSVCQRPLAQLWISVYFLSSFTALSDAAQHGNIPAEVRHSLAMTRRGVPRYPAGVVG